MAGVPDASYDARMLLLYLTGWSLAEYMLHSVQRVTSEMAGQYAKLVQMRESRLPLQQIMGGTEFMGLPFHVTSDVLCPRPDTEILVEEVIKVVMPGQGILDLCTGSGCILISLLTHLNQRPERPAVLGIGTDISAKALSVARQNAFLNGRAARWSRFYQGDLFAALPGNHRYAFDVIVSNPPYIRSGEIDSLMPEVRDHEPRIALDGDADGLKFYRRIASKAGHYLAPGGQLFFEIGFDQKERVMQIMDGNGFTDLKCKKDLAGNDRVVSGVWK